MTTLPEILQNRSHPDYSAPVKYLQLKEQALISLEGSNITSLHQAFAASQDSALQDEAAKHVPKRLQQLGEFCAKHDCSTGIDWFAFTSQEEVGFTSICGSSPALRRLNRWDGKLPLSVLNLNLAYGLLSENAGLDFVTDFVKKVSEHLDITQIAGLGAGKAATIKKNILALNNSIDAAGNIDWQRFSKSLGLVFYPKNATKPFYGLKATMTEIVANVSNEKDRQCIEARILTHPSSRKTCEKVGDKFGDTRANVSRIEVKFITEVKDAIFESDYKSIEQYRFWPHFEEGMRQAKLQLDKANRTLWRQNDWLECISRALKTPTEELNGSLHLYAELLDYNLLTRLTGDGEQILCSQEANGVCRDHLLNLSQVIYKTLQKSITPLSDEELIVQLKSEAQQKVSIEDLTEVLALSDEFSRDKERRLYLDDSLVKRPIDRAKRFLHNLPDPIPLHYSEIFAHVFPNEVDRHTTSAIFGADPEMVPIGRSGKWALKEWGLEDKTVALVAKQLLEEADGPLSTEELAEKILELREFERNSLSALLSQRPDLFRRTLDGKWELVPLSPENLQNQ